MTWRMNGRGTLFLGMLSMGLLLGCRFDPVARVGRTEGVCGNGTLESGEECDGQDLGDETCQGLGYDFGTLACSPDCTFDRSDCGSNNPECGNGLVEGNESCDGTDLDNQTCQDLGFAGGTLACAPDCSFDTNGCSMCGNGVVDPGEDCDGSNLNGESCLTQGFDGGTLGCNDTCDGYDTTLCFTNLCGNGVVDPGEDCDGVDLNNQTCQDLGHLGGSLFCSGSCTWDETGCADVGSPCTHDADCSPGFCLTEDDFGLPHGYCTNYCDPTFPDTCQSGSHCADDGQGGSICVVECQATSDCRPGYSCFWGVCYPDCDQGQDCASGTCNEWLGRCNVPVSGEGDIGAPCTQNSDCKGWVCVAENPNTGVPNNGYCSALCSRSKGSCPGDAKCGPSGQGFDLGQCYDGCSDIGECRTGEGYICGDFAGVTGVCYDPN